MTIDEAVRACVALVALGEGEEVPVNNTRLFITSRGTLSRVHNGKTLDFNYSFNTLMTVLSQIDDETYAAYRAKQGYNA